MARVIVVLALVLAIGATTNNATAADKALYAACAPMDLSVTLELESSAREIGLTEQSIINAAESRLRGARLFLSLNEQPFSPQYLRLFVATFGPAYIVNISLRRYINDLGYGMPGVATVWTSGKFGVHANNAQYLLAEASELLDSFLVSYLRANEAHCSR